MSGCDCVLKSVCKYHHHLSGRRRENIPVKTCFLWSSSAVIWRACVPCWLSVCAPLRLLHLLYLLPSMWYDIAARLQQKPELHGRRLTSGQVRYAELVGGTLIQHVTVLFLVWGATYLNTATCGNDYQLWGRSLLKGWHASASVQMFSFCLSPQLQKQPIIVIVCQMHSSYLTFITEPPSHCR